MRIGEKGKATEAGFLNGLALFFFIRNFKVLLYANDGRGLAIPALGLLVSAVESKWEGQESS